MPGCNAAVELWGEVRRVVSKQLEIRKHNVAAVAGGIVRQGQEQQKGSPEHTNNPGHLQCQA
jgi:hypothetical protein